MDHGERRWRLFVERGKREEYEMKRNAANLLLAVVMALCLPSLLAAKMSDEAFLELCKKGSVEQVQTAIRNGANVNASNEEGSTPLHEASSDNSNPEVLKALLKAGADVNASDEWDSTPLHEAALHNSNLEVVKALLKAGADVNALDSSIITPLHNAAQNNPNHEITALLLKAGADVNALNRFGDTPLHNAAYANPNLEVLKKLLKAGAEVNAENDEGNVPLHHAVSSNTNPDVVMELLKAGADVHQMNDEGKRPFDYAEENKDLIGTAAYRKLYELSGEKKLVRPKNKIIAITEHYERCIVKFYNDNISIMSKLEEVEVFEKGTWSITYNNPPYLSVNFESFFKNTEGVMRKITLCFITGYPGPIPENHNMNIVRTWHKFDGDPFLTEGLPGWLEYEITN